MRWTKTKVLSLLGLFVVLISAATPTRLESLNCFPPPGDCFAVCTNNYTPYCMEVSFSYFCGYVDASGCFSYDSCDLCE
jgi:hypothetical protein